MIRPTTDQRYKDWLNRGLYALRSQVDGLYNVDWQFMIESDGSGGYELGYETDSDGNLFLGTEDVT